MLLTKVLHRIFVQFCVNFRPSVPPKSRFSLERVVDFEVFRMFLPNILFNTFTSQFWTLWASFWQLWKPFWAPFHASWGVLRSLLTPSSTLLPQKPVLKANFWTPNCPNSPQDTSKASQNQPKSTLAAHLELQNRRKSTKMTENQLKSMKINHNQPKKAKKEEIGTCGGCFAIIYNDLRHKFSDIFPISFYAPNILSQNG